MHNGSRKPEGDFDLQVLRGQHDPFHTGAYHLLAVGLRPVGEDSLDLVAVGQSRDRVDLRRTLDCTGTCRRASRSASNSCRSALAQAASDTDSLPYPPFTGTGTEDIACRPRSLRIPAWRPSRSTAYGLSHLI